ncbi:MAG: hypothetical protein Q7S74_06160 [Nanoarchaeota archaeon]|nr:hypothetical protein [Nanoarchaeota archaeon]
MKASQLIFLGIILTSLFVISYTISWTNAYAVQHDLNDGNKINGFLSNAPPLLLGVLVVCLVGALIVITMEEKLK